MTKHRRGSADNLRVAAFTGGTNVPSRRFRLAQYIDPVRTLGLSISEFPARFGAWPPAAKFVRPAWALASLLDRLPGVAISHRFDATFIQREFISTLSTLERWTKAPRIFDVDDAVWEHGARARTAFERNVSSSQAVIAGNSTILEYARSLGAQCTVIPTPVDTERFRPATATSRRTKVIGWSGSSSGLKYLEGVAPALRRVLNSDPAVRLLVHCDRAPHLPELPRSQVDFIRWSPDNEVHALTRIDVGIMPLPDEPFARGKCSYKMLLYMACGVPVVVSPVGMNAEVLQSGECGYAATTEAEWTEALVALLESPPRRQEFGDRGRQIVERDYALDRWAPEFCNVLRAAASTHGE